MQPQPAGAHANARVGCRLGVRERTTIHHGRKEVIHCCSLSCRFFVVKHQICVFVVLGQLAQPVQSGVSARLDILFVHAARALNLASQQDLWSCRPSAEINFTRMFFNFFVPVYTVDK